MSDLQRDEVEIKLAFLERHIEEQDRVILAMRTELAALKRELARLNDRVQSAGSDSAAPPADEKPPHY